MKDIKKITNNRQMKALTGLNISEFNILLSIFEKILYEQFANKKRQRAVGGGRKGALIDAYNKLFFLLFYLKVYPTYDLAGFIFGADRSRCCRWVKNMMPLLEKALGRTTTLPKRRINSMAELLEICPDINNIFIDGTERKTQRPSKSKRQKRTYSGKKKMHSRKNTIICNERRRILVISPTKNGKIHDFKQLQKAQILESVPQSISLWVDKGYQGILGFIKNENEVMMPKKKPNKSELTEDERQENRVISGVRMVVEHAIGGLKRFGAMTGIYRNRRGQDDLMIRICGGLWNLHLDNV